MAIFVYHGILVYHGRQQFTIVSQIKRDGGQVRFCHAVKPPKWIKNFEDRTRLIVANYVTEVNLSDTNVVDADLTDLQALGKVYILDLSNTRISDTGMLSVSKMEYLRTLDVSGTRVTDAGMDQIAKMPRLCRIVVRDTNVTEKWKAKTRRKRPNLQIVP